MSSPGWVSADAALVAVLGVATESFVFVVALVRTNRDAGHLEARRCACVGRQFGESQNRSCLHQDERIDVKPIFSFCLVLSCAAIVSLSGAGGETSPRIKRHVRHAPAVNALAPPALAEQAPNGAAAPPFSWLTRFFPDVKPYPPGQGDADGLSRNIEDCNKGCIGVPLR